MGNKHAWKNKVHVMRCKDDELYNAIVKGLQHTMNDHNGVINRVLIGSASKRIIGSINNLLDSLEKQES